MTVRAKSLAVFGTEVFDGIVINHDLVHDLKAIAFQLAGGALAHDIKSTNLFNFIVKQINTQRLFGTNRKDIQNITPDSVFSGLVDLFNSVVAVDDCVMDKVIKIKFAAGFNLPHGI